MHICVYTHVYMYIWQCLKNIGLVTGPGGLFATRLATRLRGLATNPPCTSLFKTIKYSTQIATKVCNRGPATKVCNRRGVPRQTPISRHSHTYIYIYMYTYVYTYTERERERERDSICIYRERGREREREREREGERERERKQERDTDRQVGRPPGDRRLFAWAPG